VQTSSTNLGRLKPQHLNLTIISTITPKMGRPRPYYITEKERQDEADRCAPDGARTSLDQLQQWAIAIGKIESDGPRDGGKRGTRAQRWKAAGYRRKEAEGCQKEVDDIKKEADGGEFGGDQGREADTGRGGRGGCRGGVGGRHGFDYQHAAAGKHGLDYQSSAARRDRRDRRGDGGEFGNDQGREADTGRGGYRDGIVGKHGFDYEYSGAGKHGFDYQYPATDCDRRRGARGNGEPSGSPTYSPLRHRRGKIDERVHALTNRPLYNRRDNDERVEDSRYRPLYDGGDNEERGKPSTYRPLYDGYNNEERANGRDKEEQAEASTYRPFYDKDGNDERWKPSTYRPLYDGRGKDERPKPPAYRSLRDAPPLGSRKKVNKSTKRKRTPSGPAIRDSIETDPDWDMDRSDAVRDSKGFRKGEDKSWGNDDFRRRMN
jgi:hypothetical protein